MIFPCCRCHDEKFPLSRRDASSRVSHPFMIYRLYITLCKLHFYTLHFVSCLWVCSDSCCTALGFCPARRHQRYVWISSICIHCTNLRLNDGLSPILLYFLTEWKISRKKEQVVAASTQTLFACQLWPVSANTLEPPP